MPDLTFYQKRREALKESYLPGGEGATTKEGQTAGVDHLPLICSDLERTLGFMQTCSACLLHRIGQNRDEPTSTHIFFDIGGGNQLAFFDFPEKGPGRTVRGVGSMHHVAIKAQPEQMRAIIGRLDQHRIPYSMH
jgi:catechol 2,3-dioxygenase-like lactoylglutathione lyase family enzyme